MESVGAYTKNGIVHLLGLNLDLQYIYNLGVFLVDDMSREQMYKQASESNGFGSFCTVTVS